MKRTASVTLMVLLLACFLIPAQALAQRNDYIFTGSECGGAAQTAQFELGPGERVEIYDVNITYSSDDDPMCNHATVIILGNQNNGSRFFYQFRVNNTESIYRKFKKPIVFDGPHTINVELSCDPFCQNPMEIPYINVILNGKVK